MPSLTGISILEPRTSTSVSGQCAMDAAGAVVIQLLAVDFVTFNGVQFVMSLLKTIVARIRGTRAQITFEISAMTVRVIYTQLLWWSSNFDGYFDSAYALPAAMPDLTVYATKAACLAPVNLPLASPWGGSKLLDCP